MNKQGLREDVEGQQPTMIVDNSNDLVEIQLSDVLVFLKRSRRVMLIGGMIGALLGGGYAVLLSNMFSTRVTIMPEVQTKNGLNLGNLGSLAGLAGVNLDNLTNAAETIRPELYPTVVASVPFSLHLLQSDVYSTEFKLKQRLEAYLMAHKEQTLLGRLDNLLTSDDQDKLVDPTNHSGMLQLTKGQEKRIEEIQNNIIVDYDKKTGIITLSVTMPDPVVATMVANQSLAFLKNYITSYRTQKARTEANFLEKQVIKAKQRYQAAEYALSTYRDRNRSLFLNTAKIEEQRIQADYTLAQDIYNTLSKQAEMAKIKVQEETPVFQVLDPAQVPLKKSKPKRLAYIIVFTVLGLFVGLSTKIVKEMGQWIKNRP